MGLRRTDFVPLGLSDCAGVWTFAAGVESKWGPALLFGHHPAAAIPMPIDWSCHDDTYEPVVEVYSEHGNSLSSTTDYDPLTDPVDASTAESALSVHGYHLGFVGGTDHHDTQPGETCSLDSEHPSHPYSGGLTMVMLDEGQHFDRMAIHDAMVQRHTLVTTGPEMPTLVSWTLPDGTTALSGDDIGVGLGGTVGLDVSVPADLAALVTSVQAIGPDEAIDLEAGDAGTWHLDLATSELPAWLYVAVEIDGATWYGPDGCPDGGDDREFVWSSPNFFNLVDDIDGDGRSGTLDCDETDPTSYLGAPELWYDGKDESCDGDSDFDQDHDGVIANEGGGHDCDDTNPAVGDPRAPVPGKALRCPRYVVRH